MRCNDVLNLHKKSIELQKDINNVEHQLKDLRTQMRICPLCGKPWEMCNNEVGN